MVYSLATQAAHKWPTPGAILALLKPITWFPPIWAYACGAISAGPVAMERWGAVLVGMVLAGPLLCGTSQAINDWFDRHVDAINEPDRVIPSGRMPGYWGLGVAISGSVLSVLVAASLGSWVLLPAMIGLALAWAYSAPPFRLKTNGWFGNAAVGFSYESLPWITAASAAAGSFAEPHIIIVALLYGLGAHGIMTLNDFKSIEGDRQFGIDSLPVQLGATRAATLAGVVMIIPQLGVIAILAAAGAHVAALLVLVFVVAQGACLPRLLRDPLRHAVWYSGVGVGLYVAGMMVTAFALAAMQM
jgi:chlorophyll synthase